MYSRNDWGQTRKNKLTDIAHIFCKPFTMPPKPRSKFTGTFYHVIVLGNHKLMIS